MTTDDHISDAIHQNSLTFTVRCGGRGYGQTRAFPTIAGTSFAAEYLSIEINTAAQKLIRVICEDHDRQPPPSVWRQSYAVYRPGALVQVAARVVAEKAETDFVGTARVVVEPGYDLLVEALSDPLDSRLLVTWRLAHDKAVRLWVPKSMVVGVPEFGNWAREVKLLRDGMAADGHQLEYIRSVAVDQRRDFQAYLDGKIDLATLTERTGLAPTPPPPASQPEESPDADTLSS